MSDQLLDKSIRVVNELNESQLQQLMMLYQEQFWSRDRALAQVRQMLANSDVVLGLLDERQHLIGFCRVLTDFVYKANIYDVIIHEGQRNQGLGAYLMELILHHPQLKEVEQFDLQCLPEMVPFYERWGFSADLEGLKWMRRKKPKC